MAQRFTLSEAEPMEPVEIVFSSNTEALQYYKTISSKYYISPGACNHRGVSANVIVEEFKKGLLQAAEKANALDCLLAFVHKTLIIEHWGDDSSDTNDSVCDAIQDDGAHGDIEDHHVAEKKKCMIRDNLDDQFDDDAIEYRKIQDGDNNVVDNGDDDDDYEDVTDDTVARDTINTEKHYVGLFEDMDTEYVLKIESNACEYKARIMDFGMKETSPCKLINKSSLEVKEMLLKTDENTICKLPFAALALSRADILDICCQSGVDLNMLLAPTSINMLMYFLTLSTLQENILGTLLNTIDVHATSEFNGKTALTVLLTNLTLEPSLKSTILKTLINAGSSMKTSGQFHSGAIHAYVRAILGLDTEKPDENWREIMDILLDADDVINSKDYHSRTPLMEAIASIPPDGELPSGYQSKQIASSVVHYLLNKGADPEIRDVDGRSSLFHSVLTQNLDTMKVVLQYCKESNIKDLMGMTPIYELCGYVEWQFGDPELESVLYPMLEALKNAGWDINAHAIDKSTVLHYAAAKQPHTVCDKLCLLGADVNMKDYLQRTPLHLAARNEDSAVVNVLLQYGACIDATDKNNETPLHQACLFENQCMSKVLVTSGANIEATTVLGVRPLHMTAENGDADFIEYITGIADISSEDNDGAQALHYAAASGNVEAIEHLLRIGCDRNHRTSDRKRPLEFATQMGYRTTLLFDTESIRFGNLPPMVFPNRPLVREDQIDAYYSDLVAKFTDENASGVKVAKSLISSNGLGVVQFAEGESKDISDLVVKYAEDVAKRIGEIDPMFRCKLLRAGSTYEGVKTGYPDEFDFLCELTVMADYVEKIGEGETEGFAKLLLRNNAPKEVLKFCLRWSRCISATYVLRYFSRLTTLAAYDVNRVANYDGHVYIGCKLLPEYSPLFTGQTYPLTKLNSQTLTYRGKTHKCLDISIDLNPVIFSSQYPTQAVQTCHLIPNVPSHGIYLIPKLCRHVVGHSGANMPPHTDLWRVSTQHVEAKAMRALPQLARDCYTVCKVFRMEPLTCSVKYHEYNMMDLSVDELKILFPNGMLEKTYETDSDITESVADVADIGGNNDDDDHDDDDDDDDDNEMNYYPHLEKQITAEDETDEKARIGYVEREMTAEKAIPSYYIKTIFLKEMERMLEVGEELSESSLVHIPRRVYELLLKAIEENNLSTLFMPSHNILRPGFLDTSNSMTVHLREIYCRKIICLMDGIGFH